MQHSKTYAKTNKTRNTHETREARQARHESASKRRPWTRTDKRSAML